MKVTNGNDEMEIAVPSRCIEVAIDGAEMTALERDADRFKEMLGSGNIKSSGNNRGDVGLALRELGSQIRAGRYCTFSGSFAC